MDALCYSLFNKPFRRVNLPQLINTQNKKGLLTEVEFAIGNSEFLVRRGMKPKVFEVYKDGEQIENKAADRDTQTLLEQISLTNYVVAMEDEHNKENIINIFKSLYVEAQEV